MDWNEHFSFVSFPGGEALGPWNYPGKIQTRGWPEKPPATFRNGRNIFPQLKKYSFCRLPSLYQYLTHRPTDNMKALHVFFIVAVVLGVSAPAMAAKAHPMTDQLLSGFARALYGQDRAREALISGKAPCLLCTLGMLRCD